MNVGSPRPVEERNGGPFFFFQELDEFGRVRGFPVNFSYDNMLMARAQSCLVPAEPSRDSEVALQVLAQGWHHFLASLPLAMREGYGRPRQWRPTLKT